MTPLVLLGLTKPPVSDLDVALRIGLALLLGGLIGFEREMSHQAAGLRTHIAVALGAALFGVISVQASTPTCSPGRTATTRSTSPGWRPRWSSASASWAAGRSSSTAPACGG